MPAKLVPIRIPRKCSGYEVRVGSGLLESSGQWVSECVGKGTRRVAIISNKRVFGLYGDIVSKSLISAGFETAVYLIGDGERYKSLRTLEKTLQFLGEYRFSRTDAVVSLGGGVVGDLAGFAASVYLRGIAFLQIPTTLLSMIDSSVGGKTGVNSAFGKNLIGSFYQPSGVLIDIDGLATLDRRELTAGFCEAIKQGAIAGRELFDKTADFLSSMVPEWPTTGFADTEEDKALVDLIAAQITFKAQIVEGDERESTAKTGASSRKILNFGHTLAHALEKITDYKRFKHGEAVGHGIMFAASLSNKLELLGQNEVKLLNDVVQTAGPLPRLRDIEPSQIVEAIAFDKKVVNDSLQWVLLKKIGAPVIVSNSSIPQHVLIETIHKTLQD
jgi:3-dehydroquinate synthase